MADIYGSEDAQGETQGEPAPSPAENEALQAEQESKEKKRQEEIVSKAKKCLELSKEAENEIRRDALDDIEFSLGKQWPTGIEQDRNADGRPCLVINRLHQTIQQVTNDQRQNRPAIKVHPVSSGANEETGKIIQGLIRHIEYNSNAESAYDTAYEFAVRGGFGFWRVVHDYVSPDSFDQDIFIKRVRNPFSVHLDPAHQEPDGSDANWALITDYLDQDEYQRTYPDSKLADLGEWKSLGDQAPDWMQAGSACVAEYFYKEFEPKTAHLLSTGETVLDDNLASRLQAAQMAGLPVSIKQSRPVKVPVVHWVKLNGVEVLEETIWPGKYIPVIPVYGNEINVNGKKTLQSLIRQAKDPQRMYNYWASAETEAIALAPRAPFIGAEGQFEGHEDAWKNANRRNQPYLQYKPTSLNGEPLSPPQRQAFEPAVQAITQARMQSADEIKATTGVYDPTLGKQQADISGIAIQKLNTQAQTSNFHFVDNLTRSQKHTGRILVDLIPHIFDGARAQRIIGDDGSHDIVKLNQKHVDDNGKEVLYAMDVGTYDVTVDVGPGYASKRQEAAATMQEMARAYPPLMQVVGDLMVRNMDWPGADEIADRLKKMLPAPLQDDGKNPNAQLPPQVQAKLKSYEQMIDQLSQKLHQASDDLKTKRLDLEHKERVEFAKIQADIEINLAKLGVQSDVALLNNQVEAIQHRLELLNSSIPIGADLAPEEQSQSLGQDASAGGQPAQGSAPEPSPTGGPSPGQPMEGQ